MSVSSATAITGLSALGEEKLTVAETVVGSASRSRVL